MPKGTCSFDGCERQQYCKGWCKPHYYQAHKGNPMKPIRGDVPPPSCSFDGCSLPTIARGLCSGHYQQRHRSGRELRPLYAVTTYFGIHNRVKAMHGSAADHLCVACLGPAADWAYDNADPDERLESLPVPSGKMHDCPFSLKPEHYLPMCKPCHRKFDALRSITRPS